MLDRLISLFPKPRKSAGSAPTAYADAARVANSDLFDEAFYLTQAQSAGIEVDCFPQLHYVRAGYKMLNPHPLFDAAYYREKAGLGEEVNSLLHFLEQDEDAPLPHPDYDVDAFARNNYPIVLAPHGRAFSFEHGRYLYALAVAFNDAGCPIYLEMPSNVSRDRNRFPFFDILTEESWVSYLQAEDELPDDAIYLTDSSERASEGASLLWQRKLPARSPASYICPFPMHARQYQSGMHRHLKWLRSRPRRTCIYFSGATGWPYRIPYFSLRYRMTGRAKLLEVLDEKFGDRIDPGIVKNYRLYQRKATDAPMVIASQRHQRSPQVVWMDQLAHADFFLCLPGAYVPIAHNIVEAMAVGTIPILAYPHYLHPALQDGVNCLVYTDATSFTQTIERALAMPEDEKARMRQEVTAYYDRFLDPVVWAKKVLQDNRSQKQLFFPYESRLKTDWASGIRH